MAKYNVVRMGDKIHSTKVDPNNADDVATVERLNEMLSHVDVTIGTFECDCVEKMEAQKTFTKAELITILNCPIKHKGI